MLQISPKHPQTHQIECDRYHPCPTPCKHPRFSAVGFWILKQSHRRLSWLRTLFSTIHRRCSWVSVAAQMMLWMVAMIPPSKDARSTNSFFFAVTRRKSSSSRTVFFFLFFFGRGVKRNAVVKKISINSTKMQDYAHEELERKWMTKKKGKFF